MKRLIIICFIVLFTTSARCYNAVLFNGAGTSFQDKLVAITIAGIVNRDSARLYLLNINETWSWNQTDESWRDLYRSRGNVVFDSITGIQQLVNKFRSYIKGAVTYDPYRWFSNFTGQNFMWQGEFAAMLGGLTDRIPLSPAQAVYYNIPVSDSILINDYYNGDSSVWVTGRLELASHPWNDPTFTEENKYLTLLNWGIQNILPRCNPKKFYLREISDYAIQQRMFQCNLAGTDDLDFNSLPAARAGVLESILNYLHSQSQNTIFHIYGWMRPEPLIQWFMFFGASMHETLLGNLSFHSSFPVAARQYNKPSNIDTNSVVPEQKYYIVFVGSEGDAGNWNIGFQAGAWMSPKRGTIPVNWAWNLEMLNEFPFIASYYYDTATPNDGFLSAISPLGYCYPDIWPAESLPGAIDSSKFLMSKFNIRQIYGYKHYCGSGSTNYRGKIIKNSFNFAKLGEFQNDINASLTILYDPLLPLQTPILTYGTLLFNHCGDESFYGDVSNLDVFANRIITSLAGKPRPYYLLAGYQRYRQDDFSNRNDPASSDISIDRLSQVVDKLKNNPSIGSSIEVCTIEKFSALMRRTSGLSGLTGEKSTVNNYKLYQNYPNPFNPVTIISYNLKSAGYTRLEVFDILGKRVKELINEIQPAGMHKVEFDGTRLPSGVYFYKLTSGQCTETKKLVLLK